MYNGSQRKYASSPSENIVSGGNGQAPRRQEATAPARGVESPANGRKAIDFVSEDDVRRAIQKGEKIYINSRTIITPAARDIADPAEVFAKV